MPLNLSSSNFVTLPASSFPSPADCYVCDECGRDLTNYLHPGRAHVEQAMGPSRYECLCGQKYLTGAAEWDHLGPWARRRRAKNSLGLGTLFSAPLLIVGIAFCLILHCSTRTLGVVSAFGLIPFFLMNVPFWLKVTQSIWRTRIGSSATSKDS